MTAPSLPPHESQEYLWWSAGALDESRARDEGMSGDARQVRDLLEGLGRSHPDWDIVHLALSLARICCPHYLKRRHRWH